MVESDLDETTLQAIADATGGRYFRAEDPDRLQRIYDQINALERSDVTRQVYVNWQEQAGILLAAAFAALVFERLLRHTAFQIVP